MEIEIKFRQYIFTRPPPDPKSIFTIVIFFVCMRKKSRQFLFFVQTFVQLNNLLVHIVQHIISSHFKHAYHQFTRLQKVISNHKIIQLAKRDFQHWKRSPHAL